MTNSDASRSTASNPVISLWLAVLEQAIREASYRGKAHAWIFERKDEADFFAVCALAQVDPSWVRQQTMRFLAGQDRAQRVAA